MLISLSVDSVLCTDQVKFTIIWHCDPLFEDEFRDAIRDNYFGTYKFNFGLSKEQVCLFTSFDLTFMYHVPRYTSIWRSYCVCTCAG